MQFLNSSYQTIMKCPSCGAEVSPARGKCEYCGSTVELPKPHHPPARPTRDAVFERICSSPQYERRNSAARQKKLPVAPPSGDIGSILTIVGFVFVGVFMFGGFIGADGLSPGAAFTMVVFLGIVALLVVLVYAVKAVKEENGDNRASEKGEAVIIATKRTAVSGEGNNSSTSTTYFITAEFYNGHRKEYKTVVPELYGKVAEGDAGILFVHDAYALDFDRVMSLRIEG